MLCIICQCAASGAGTNVSVPPTSTGSFSFTKISLSHRECLHLLWLWQGVWALSLLIAVPALVQQGPIPSTHLEALLGAAACGAVFAELFCIKSLLTFEPREPPSDTDVSEPLWNLKHVRSQHYSHLDSSRSGATPRATSGLGMQILGHLGRSRAW